MPVPTLASVTPMGESSSTGEPQRLQASPLLPAYKSTTPLANATAMPGTSLGIITGTLVYGSGGGIPDGQNVTLVGFDQDQTGSYQKALEIQSQVNRDGSYSFTGVELALNRAFLIITNYGGVEYQSDPVIVKDATTKYSIPITIYDKTNDFNVLTVDQVHLKFDLSSQNVIQVTELYIVTNPGKQVVVVSSDGATIPFLASSRGAGSVQYQLAQGSAQLLECYRGVLALLPGADKQYGSSLASACRTVKA